MAELSLNSVWMLNVCCLIKLRNEFTFHKSYLTFVEVLGSAFACKFHFNFRGQSE
jgi:hypothetical protein